MSPGWEPRLPWGLRCVEAAGQRLLPVAISGRHETSLPWLPTQLQGAAIEAAARLDEALSQPRSSSAALKSVLSKAEAAAAAAAPGACQFAPGAELLAPRIAGIKGKLEVERAAEGLARAAAACKAVADLPRLEAAILAARKVGATDLDPESYK